MSVNPPQPRMTTDARTFNKDHPHDAADPVHDVSRLPLLPAPVVRIVHNPAVLIPRELIAFDNSLDRRLADEPTYPAILH